jgi:hypothetical protein
MPALEIVAAEPAEDTASPATLSAKERKTRVRRFQPRCDVGGAAKEAERMIKAQARHTVRAGCTCNGKPIEIQAAREKGVRQIDRVCVQRRDHVRTRREVLCPAGMREHLGDNGKKQQPYDCHCGLCAILDKLLPLTITASGEKGILKQVLGSLETVTCDRCRPVSLVMWPKRCRDYCGSDYR